MSQDELVIPLTSYSKKGVARGEAQAKKFEVRGGIVGETVSACIERKKRGVTLARLETVKTPSINRIPPRCGHFPSCGGCTFQQLSYSAQLTYKQSLIETLFGRARSILPSPKQWQYRNKMEYTFSQDKEGNRYLGLIKAQSKGRVITLSECHLTADWFLETLTETNAWWKQHNLQAYNMFKDTGHLRNLIVREATNTGERMIILVVSGNPDYALPKEALDDFVARMIEKNEGVPLHIFLKIHQCIKGQPTQFFEVHLHGNEWLTERLDIPGYPSKTIKISPSAFFQPNGAQVGNLYAKALELAAPQKTDLVYDLYCGTGTIGLAFAPLVRSVKGIELNPYAVYDAHANIEANELDNIEVVRGDVGALLADMPTPDIALIDPPRVGIEPKAMMHLKNLRAQKLVYISCNPYTQAENVAELTGYGYTVTAVQPVDQFPHTVHCENIVVLQLNKQ